MDKGQMDAGLAAQWDRVQDRLREEFGDAAFKSWVKPMTVAGLQDGAVTLAVPTRFIRDWVLTHYADRIRSLWNGENPMVRNVDVTVVAGAPRLGPEP
ncbi:MAG: chromosomal replication initiator protein DnaA, partial [Caenispirillum bisanense]|nr:chromosomal replication initiator protein DnaA [Caenispirillum bisanense]